MIFAETTWTSFVPVVALIFTVASFWWIYLRRGSLVATRPATYASAETGQQIRIRFPITIFNTGAATIVIEDLRLVVDKHEFEWIMYRRSVRPTPDDDLDFASPFSIRGRDARELFLEFGVSPPTWRPEPGRAYPVRIERRHGERWKTLLGFEWWSPTSGIGSYIAHRNAPPTPSVSPHSAG